MIILKVIAATIAATVGYIIFENALARFTPDWIAATIAIIAALTLGYLIVK